MLNADTTTLTQHVTPSFSPVAMLTTGATTDTAHRAAALPEGMPSK